MTEQTVTEQLPSICSIEDSYTAILATVITSLLIILHVINEIFGCKRSPFFLHGDNYAY
jgi:hypothetical protein